MKKNSKIFVYSLLGLLLASFVFFVFTVAYSFHESISVLGFKLDAYNRTETKFLELEATHIEWQNIDKTYDQFKNDYLIRFDDYPAFRSEMQAVLSRNALQLEKINHRYRNIMKDIRKVVIDSRIVGAYRNVKKFIFEMENKTEMVLFKKIEMSKLDAANVKVTFSMEVYFVR
ncbi:MAG: hypothetical protein KAW12_09125 [Candidatus Aminicenantes bacterium]|nr:hypothetical protein [Candidatus Aminicenantes bacterium]